MSILQVQQRTSSGLTNVGQFPQSIVGSMGSAIIESGSNANGNYVKFADGTLICCSISLAMYPAVLQQTINIPFNFATQFIDTNISNSFSSPGPTDLANLDEVGNCYANGPIIMNLSTTSAKMVVDVHRYAQSRPILWKVSSIGRWK